MRSPASRQRKLEAIAPARAPMRQKRTTQEMIADGKGPGLAVTALRTLLGFAVVIAVGAAIFFGAAALEGNEATPLAPWNDASAPSVAPEPLAVQ